MAKRTSWNVVMRCAAAFALVPIAMAWGCTYRSGFDVEGVDAQVPLRAIGVVGVANVRTTSVDLAWASASGGLAPPSELYYQVYFSTSLPIGTVSEAHAGTPFGAALVGVTGVTVTGLVPATKYGFNIIVSDGKGNEAAYEAASATTLDATPATGAVLVSNVSRNQVELSWPKATDDRTPQSELVYQAYYSTRAPFDTLSEVRAGTAVGSPAKDIAGVTVTGLAGATTYSFNVVVTDTDGLSSTYVAGMVETAANPAVAITAPPANSYANAANASSFAVSGTCSEEGRAVAVSGAGTASGTCSSGAWSATVDVSGAAEGPMTLKVDLADSAGNAATQALRGFLKDTVAPMVAITAPPANSYVTAANASSFVVSGTCSEEGRTVAVSGAGTATGICNSGEWSATVDVRGATEGTITLKVDLTDSAGNAATQALRDFLKDTVAVTVAITAPPANSYANAANASSFGVSGTCSEEGRPVAVSGAGTATGTCISGAWSAMVDVSDAAEGLITLRVDLTNSAGKAATQALRDFLKDTVAPMVAITAPPANSYATAANASSFAVSGTCSEEGRTVAVSGAGTATGICSSGAWSATLDMRGATEGTITLKVDLTDTAGNAATQARRDFLKDTVAPTVAITAPPANSYANAANASSFAVSGTCSEQGRTVAVSGAGTASGTCSSGTWSAMVDVRGATDGPITLQVDLADSAGNAATQARRDFLKDTVAPTVTVTAPPANSYANTANASSFAVSGTCSEEGRTVAVSGAGTATGTCSAGAWSVAVDVRSAAEGPITLKVDFTDSAGNAATQARRDFLKDTVAPALAITAPPANSYATAASASSFVVSGTCSEEGRTVAVSGAGTATGTCSSGAWSATVDVRGAADGPITLKADLTDSAGNAATQARRDFLKDTVAPAVAIAAPPANSYANAANASSFSVWGTCSEEGRTVAVSGAGTATGTCSSGTWSATVNVSGAQEGVFTLTANLTDATGQAAKASVSFIKDTVAPAAPIGAASITTTRDKPTFGWAPGGGDGAGIFRVKLDDPNLASGAIEILTMSFTPANSLVEGAHTAYIQERDAAGNWSATGTTSATVVLIPNGCPSCNYVRPISVTESSSNNLLDYQVLVVLDPATFDYSHVLASNGGDIRFAMDGTECSYWIESWDTSGASKIWVKLPGLSSGETKKMYMYYGDASAAPVSNGDNTFILFDDFNDNSLDPSKWSDTSGAPAGVEEVNQMLHCKMANSPALLRGWVRSAAQIAETNIALHFTSLFETAQASLVVAFQFDGNHSGLFDYPANAFVLDWYFGISKIETLSVVNTIRGTISSLAGRSADAVPHRFEFRRYRQNLEVLENGVVVLTGTSSQSFAAGYVGLAGGEMYLTDSATNTYFDDVFVRKHVSPEPGVTVGAEILNR